MVKSFFPKEVLVTLLFAIVLSAISFFVFKYLVPQHYFAAFPFIVVLFTLFSIFSQRFLDEKDSDRPQTFLHRFMFVTSAKLFLLLIVVVLYILVIRDKAAAFLNSLLIIYFFFLIFDISILLHKTRTPNQKNN